MGTGNYRVIRLSSLIIFFGVVALFLLLWAKMQLGQIRYFDADELAYLHWAHNVFDGKLPYRDFLSYVPPLFYAVLSVLFTVVEGVGILSGARFFSLFIFVLLCACLVWLFSRARTATYAVYAAVFLAFLPMPADKLIEVRPDTMAMLVALVAMVLHGIALTGSRRTSLWAVSGLLYGVSVLILPKTVPQVAVAGLVTVVWLFFAPGDAKGKNRLFSAFLSGGIIPFVCFGIWVLFRLGVNSVDTVIYSLVRLPLEVNRLGIQFPLQPDLFFYPNTVLYGQEGWGAGLIVTHILWIIGIGTASMRLVTPYIPGGKKEAYRELLIAGSFFAYAVMFIYGYPMRHSQYLIPIAVFVAFYTADFLGIVMSRLNTSRLGRIIGTVFLIGMLVGAVHLTRQTTGVKMGYTNAEDYAVLSYALRTIPKNAYVFDLVGSTIYFRDPFYVSAVPFGQWLPYVTRPFGSVVTALETTNTRYIYEGRLSRVESLPAATTAHIRRLYAPVPGIPGMLRQ